MKSLPRSSVQSRAGQTPRGSSAPSNAQRSTQLVMRVLLATGSLLPIAVLAGGGCDSPTQYDDFCGWIRDEENCYREFFIDVEAKCGATPTTQAGQFLTREKLDLCVLTGGGQVLFDPPIDLASPPPDNLAPIKVKMINADATKCGEIEFRAKYDFSITIEGDPMPADPSDVGDEFIVGGTFNVSGGKDTDTLSVTCPTQGVSTSSFEFNRLQLADCPTLQAIAPQAELQFNSGGVETAGVVRLFIYYPPIEGELEGASPVPINYYECIIPAAPPFCENGIQDGAETDVDCGGSFCAKRCEDSQACIGNDDCLSKVCSLQEGLKKCAGP